MPLLSVSGDDQVSYFQQPETDWQLRSASPPYDSLAELANDYHVGFSKNNAADFAVVPAAIAIVEYNSPVKGGSATPTIRISRHLLPEEVTLGLRIILDDAVVRREAIDASKIEWEVAGNTLRGSTNISIPEGSSIQCILRYRGRAMHYGWLADPEGKANPLRTLFRAFDPDLVTLGDYLFVEPGKGKSGKSTDLEHGVAWLLWMLGFAVLDLGVSPKTSDAVDIVAVSPSGIIFLIECTIGLLKADQKLARLAARTFKVKRDLLGTNRKVIPIIVTSLTKDEVRPELADAAALEVLVLTREDIQYALETRSLFQPHPEKLAAQAERALNATMPKENKR